MPDPGQRHGEQRHRGSGRIVLDAALPHRRPYVEGVVGPGQVVEAFDGVDVDEEGGAAKAHGQDGNQGLAAGQDLGVVACFGQGGDGLRDGGRADVVERGSLHRATGPGSQACASV